MTVDHPQFGTMCEICFAHLEPGECATDPTGQRWDVCAGECARQAAIIEAPRQYRFSHHGCGCRTRHNIDTGDALSIVFCPEHGGEPDA